MIVSRCHVRETLPSQHGRLFAVNSQLEKSVATLSNSLSLPIATAALPNTGRAGSGILKLGSNITEAIYSLGGFALLADTGPANPDPNTKFELDNLTVLPTPIPAGGRWSAGSAVSA